MPSADRVVPPMFDAYALAGEGEPGPVVVQLTGDALPGRLRNAGGRPCRRLTRPRPTPKQCAGGGATAGRAPGGAVRGAGGQGRRCQVRALAERLSAPVATTPSGRGTLPEDHPLALGFDGIRAGPEALNALMAEADAVLILGAKLGHNGTAGFAVRFPRIGRCRSTPRRRARRQLRGG